MPGFKQLLRISLLYPGQYSVGNKSKISSCRHIIRFHAWGPMTERVASAGLSPESAYQSKAEVKHLGPDSCVLVVPVSEIVRLCGAIPGFPSGLCFCRLTRITAQHLWQAEDSWFQDSHRLTEGLRYSCGECPSLK